MRDERHGSKSTRLKGTTRHETLSAAGKSVVPPERASEAVRIGSDVAVRLLDRRAIQECTALDISTIYRRVKDGTFPSPLQIGRRRVAWRESDVAAWQTALEVGVHKP